MAYTGETLAKLCDTVAVFVKQPNEGFTRDQITQRTGNTSNTVNAHVTALRFAGLVYRRMGKGRGRGYLYYWQPMIFYFEDEE